MADPLWKMRKARGAGNLYSHSSLSAYEECAWRWYAAYALGLKSPPAPATAFGHLFHSVATEMCKAVGSGLGPEEVSVWSWIPIVRAKMGAEAGLVPASADKEVEAAVYAAASAIPPIDEVRDAVSERVMIQPLPAGDGPVGELDLDALEARLGERDQDDKAYGDVCRALEQAGADAIEVKADLVLVTDGNVRLRDWKTNTPSQGRRTVQEQLRDHVVRYTPQLQLYGAVLRRRFKGEVHCDLQFVRYSPDPVEVPAGKEALDGAAKRAVRLIKSLSTAAGTVAAAGEASAALQAFPKNVGDACRFCHVAHLRLPDGRPACPEGQKAREDMGATRWDLKDAQARRDAGIIWEGDEAVLGRVVTTVASPGAAAAGAGAITDESAGAAESEMATAEVEAAPETEEAPPRAQPRFVTAADPGWPTLGDLFDTLGKRWDLRDGPLPPHPDPGLPSGDKPMVNPDDPEDRARVATLVTLYEEGARRWTERARVWRAVLQDLVRKHGAIRMDDDGEFGLPSGVWSVVKGSTHVEWTTDLAALEEALAKAGLDPGDFIRPAPDTRALREVLKKDQKARKALAACYETHEGDPVLKFQPARKASPEAAPEPERAAV